jgi:hypothetical protein
MIEMTIRSFVSFSEETTNAFAKIANKVEAKIMHKPNIVVMERRIK